MATRKRLISPAGAAALSVLVVGCAQEPPQVSFSKDIQPILNERCGECHSGSGAGVQKSGLDMSSYDGLIRGTRFGPVIEPGDSVSSTLVLLVEGKADPSIKMPHAGGKPLSSPEIAKIRSWIDQGAKNN
jgi:hypothetical protein